MDPLKASYREQPLALPGGKIGVLTHPVADGEPVRDAVLVLNTGVIHRVGHNRMYVTLARRLAAQGHPVLRFDLSGIGDSDKRRDALSTFEGALADIGEVADWLQTNVPTPQIAIVGLCSGANLAVLYGCRDRRIAGVVAMDPSIPRTFRYYLNNVLQTPFRRTFWFTVRKRLASRDLWRLRRARVAPEGEGFALRIEDRVVRAHVEQAYEAAINRRLSIFALLTGGARLQHNYRRQFLDAFPRLRFGELLTLEYWRRTDHTFSDAADRERLFRRIEGWLAELGGYDARLLLSAPDRGG